MANPESTSVCWIKVSGMTFNGRQLPDLDYTRIERPDGTVDEQGLPRGVPPGSSIADVLVGAARPRPAARKPKTPKGTR
jgi:hypothetical protein